MYIQRITKIYFNDYGEKQEYIELRIVDSFGDQIRLSVESWGKIEKAVKRLIKKTYNVEGAGELEIVDTLKIRR